LDERVLGILRFGNLRRRRLAHRLRHLGHRILLGHMYLLRRRLVHGRRGVYRFVQRHLALATIAAPPALRA